MKSSSNIYEGLTVETPKAMENFAERLFKEKDIFLEEEKFDKLFEKYGSAFEEALHELLDIWETPEHRATMGHDTTHISFDLLEFLYLVENVPLKKSEQYLTLFGSLLHDLGRYPEILFKERSGAIDFIKDRQIQFHAALSGYLALNLAKKYAVQEEHDQDIQQASKAFNRRVIGAVLLHGGKNETRDPIAYNVQSNDRLAGTLGTREFVRNVITDGVQRGAAVYPDERLSYDKDFPRFNNLPVADFKDASEPAQSWTNIVHYLEMPLRNIYPLSTEFGMRRVATMRRESGIILTLLSGGKDSSLYKQIFAPELQPDQNYGFPKKKLPDDVWESIIAGVTDEEKIALEAYATTPTNELIDLMLAQQAPDMPTDEKIKAHRLLIAVPPQHADDIRRTLQYVVARRGLNRVEEQKFLLSMEKGTADPLIAAVARRLASCAIFNP